MLSVRLSRLEKHGCIWYSASTKENYTLHPFFSNVRLQIEKRYGGKAVCLINRLLRPKTSLNLRNCQFLQVKVKLILLLLSFDYALHPCFSNLPKQTLHKCPLSGTKIETRVAPFLLRRLILRVGKKSKCSSSL